MTTPKPQDDRILLVALTARDAELSQRVLTAAGLQCACFRTVAEMCDAAAEGVAAIMLPQEQLMAEQVACLRTLLDQQPTWSDLPILILGNEHSDMLHWSQLLEHLGNVLLVERPVRIPTLISVARMAVRARQRQYLLRDEGDKRLRLFAAEQQARAEADAAVHARETFIAVASHELRAPLTPILGYLELLSHRLGQRSAETTPEYGVIQKVIAQVKRMNQTIERLLDISRLQSGQLQLETELLDLTRLLQRVVAELLPTLESHELVLREAGQPLWVVGDELRLQQVFTNLLGNAIKYSPDGGQIVIQLERQAQVACVRIVDQGIGIPAAALPNLFKQFYRAENVAGHAIAGMGIGLSVVQELVTLHGGEINVESQEGEGTTVTVCLPLAADAPQGKQL